MKVDAAQHRVPRRAHAASRASGTPRSTGRSSEAAAPATTAPAPARISAARPQVGEEGAPARRRRVVEQRLRDLVRRDDDDAAGGRADPELDHRATAVAAHGERGGHEREGERRQDDREHADVSGEGGQRAAEGAEVALRDLQRTGRLELARELRPHLLERRGEHRPDVGERERHRVAVAVEHRAVHVAHRGADEAA